jgi:protein tyrosine/serine phosphatase
VKKKNPLRTIVTILIIAAAIILLVKHFHIRRFNVISPGVLYTSAQPKGMDYTRLLYKYHIGTIINLRSQAEHREQNWFNEEITWARGNGVKYFEMPLDRNVDSPGHLPDADMQQQFLSIMEDKNNLPVLIHDGSGESRVAILAAVWLVRAGQFPVPQVIAAAEKIKHAPLAESEKNFIVGLSK